MATTIHDMLNGSYFKAIMNLRCASWCAAVDTLSGETIAYQYDSLKRLTSAGSTPISGSTPTAWTQTYQYDGFGNLTAKALNGTTTPIAVNAATNQLSSANYDLNGNMTSGAGATLTYDVSTGW